MRQARHGEVLAAHILLRGAAQQPPTAIAASLFCSRSSVYRVVRASRAGQRTRLGAVAQRGPADRAQPRRRLAPALVRTRRAIVTSLPRLRGWCRTRWRCAAGALELPSRRGREGSAETVRRWLPELGWGWKRATLRAKDDDPQRVGKLARIRYAFEQLQRGVALGFADEVDISRLAKVGGIAHSDQLLNEVEGSPTRSAKAEEGQTFARLQSGPGMGPILAVVLFSERHDLPRFPRVQDFLSSCRLVKCAKESNGKRLGTAGNKIGNVH